MAAESVAGVDFLELSLEGEAIAIDDTFTSPVQGGRVLLLADLVEGLCRATGSGAKVVLLTVDCLGGPAGSGFAIFQALREFSEAGGKVVAYVSGAANSAAAAALLGADLVVAHPRAVVGVHGAVALGEMDEAFEEFVRTTNRWVTAMVRARGDVPDAELARWFAGAPTLESPGGVLLSAKRAKEFGLVDFIGGRSVALDLVARLLRGERRWSARQDLLGRRALGPELAEDLRELRHTGRGIIDHALQHGAATP